MPFYRERETPERRQVLTENAKELTTWFRIRRDISAARDKTIAAYKNTHPNEEKDPPAHIVFPYKRHVGDSQTELTEWSVPVEDVLAVAGRRIGTYAANLSVTTVQTQHGFDMPVEDAHGKQLIERIKNHVNSEPVGSFLSVPMSVIEPPDFLKKGETKQNLHAADIAFWLTLWINYMEKLIVEYAQQKRRNTTTVTILVNAPSDVHNYGYTWERKKRFTYDWQTIRVFASVVDKLEQQLLADDPDKYHELQDKIEKYYETTGKQEGAIQPHGLNPQWLFLLPDILNLTFLPRGR